MTKAMILAMPMTMTMTIGGSKNVTNITKGTEMVGKNEI